LSNVDDIITRKLQLLAETVQTLVDFREDAVSFTAFQNDVKLRKASERVLQVAVEICLDIGRRIITIEKLRYPENNRDVFTVLHGAGIIPDDLLPTLHKMAGFRNLIVHDYARIDDEQVYNNLKKRLGDFDAFAAAIVQYLTND